jgi:hypothetical protein
MTTRAQRRMLNEVKKNRRISAKDLQKSLEHANISFDESTIRKTLNKNGVHGGHHRRSHCCPKKKHCCTSDVYKKASGCSTALLTTYSMAR